VSTKDLVTLLQQFKAGKLSIEKILAALKYTTVKELGFATLDLHRRIRCNMPEVIFGQGKTPDQIFKIAKHLLAHEGRVLITRVDPQAARKLKKRFPRAVYHELARCITIYKKAPAKRPGLIAVVTAGTSDLPASEEAAVTAEFMGYQVERITDVGVAGLHRLLMKLDLLTAADVLIVAAGMEGALPSVIGGLVTKPIIAVPTSIGYGTSFGGVTPLLAMLNSCANGITVVNIDNGYGAAMAAHRILSALAQK